LETLNIYDILNDNINIVFIEWGENLKMLKKYNPINISITNTKNEERRITLDFF
jgi:tRNA A37 threonylcarbamoyladenosine biosynthesis protein TsaE